MKKTLVVRTKVDVSTHNDMQIDLMKAMILAGYPDDVKPNVSFELLVEDEREQAEKMMHQVRSEFKKKDR